MCRGEIYVYFFFCGEDYLPYTDSKKYRTISFLIVFFFLILSFFQRELFTHMNVWTTFMYWPETYPQTPEDCGIQKRNVTVEADVEELDSPLVLKRDADVN